MNTTKASQNDSGRRSLSRQSSFTLVEMMVVVVIISIVIGIAIPAFQKMGAGSAVQAGTRILSAQLRLTRQYAITKRKTVALLLPTRISGLNDENCYSAMKPVIVTASGVAGQYDFDAWVEDTKWTRIPRGAVIAEVDDDKGIANGSGTWAETPQDNTVCTVTVSPANMTDLQEGLSGADVHVRAIVFSPTGRVLGLTEANATVAQLTWANGVWIWKNKGTAGQADWATPNQFNININTFTGRIKITTPDQY